MGIFGGIFDDKKETKYSAWADSFELIEESLRTDITKTFLLGAMQEDIDIPTAVRLSHLAGYGQKYDAFVRKARKSSTPPVASTFEILKPSDIDLIDNIIKDIHGPKAIIDTIDFGRLNSTYFGYKWLYKNWKDANEVKWNPKLGFVTIEILRPDGLGNTIKKQVQIPNKPVVTSYNQNNDIFGFSPYADDRIEIGFPWIESVEKLTSEGNIEIEKIEQFYLVAEVYITKETNAVINWYPVSLIKLYHVVVAFSDDAKNEKFKFWEYDVKDTRYPELAGAINKVGYWSPVALLYVDGIPYYNRGKEIKKEIEKFLKLFGLNAKKVTDEVINGVTESLPPPDKDGYTTFTDAFFYLALQPNYKIKGHNVYVVEYVKLAAKIYSAYGGLFLNKDGSIGTSVIIGGANAFNASFGISGPITYTITYEYHEPKILEIDVPNDDLTSYKKYVTQFVSVYFETRWDRPSNTFYKVPVYEVVTVGDIFGVIFVNADNGSSQLATMPGGLLLNEEVLDRLNTSEKEAVIQASLRITACGISKQFIRIKWYTAGIIKLILVIVTVILVVITRNPAFFKGLAALIGSVAIATVVMAVINMAVAVLISFTAQLVFPGTFGQIIAAVAIFWYGGGFEAFGTGNLTLESIWKYVKSKMTLGNAMQALQSVSDLYLNQQRIEMQQKYMEEMRELEDLTKDQEEKQKELEEAYYKLENNNGINPLDVRRVSKGFVAESPDQFYKRKLEKNPGVRTLKSRSEFLKVSLTVPETSLSNPALALNGFATPGV